MTDKQIMQALNCCTSKSISCQKCPLLSKSKCERELIQYSFELINRQQAEIQRLESLVKTQGIEIDELNEFANERLDKFTERYDRNLRAEVIKEFAERLDSYKEYRYNENCDFIPYVRLSDIEKVVYEMVGTENESKCE